MARPLLAVKKDDTKWLKWMHAYVIKHHIFWRMNTPSDSYWTPEKIFQLMDIAQGWVKYVIGNGNSSLLWHDYCHLLGPLIRRYGRRVVFNSGRSLARRLCSIIDEGDWKCPRARNTVVQETTDLQRMLKQLFTK